MDVLSPATVNVEKKYFQELEHKALFVHHYYYYNLHHQILYTA